MLRRPAAVHHRISAAFKSMRRRESGVVLPWVGPSLWDRFRMRWHPHRGDLEPTPPSGPPTLFITSRAQEAHSHTSTTLYACTDVQHAYCNAHTDMRTLCEVPECNAIWYLIQFILYSPISQIMNLPQRALQSVHIRHPCLRISYIYSI